MSERMTSEADEIAKNIIHNGGIPKDYAKHALDIINPQLVTLAKAHLRSQTPPHAVTRDMRCGHGYDNYIMCPICAPGPFACDALAEKPAPTPTPLTLTGEDRAFLTGLISHHKERRHDVVVQTLTELRERLSASPTPTPLTLTEEERALAKEAATITDDDAELTARALRLLGAHNTADEIKKLVTAHGRLGRALERLSASPTPTPLTLTEEERGLVEANRNWVPGLIAIIDRLSASPTAPKGEA
jgi:hypothetical protein